MKSAYPISFFLLSVASRLPLGLIRYIGKQFGNLAYRFNPSRREVTRVNLAIAFPELSADALDALCKAHLQMMGVALFDRVWLWFAPLRVVQSRISMTGHEHLNPSNQGQASILLVPHFVGLETAWPAWVFANQTAQEPAPKLTTIFQPLRSKWEDALFRYGRGRFGEILQYSRRDGVRPVIKAMKQGHTYYCLPDHDFGGKDAVFVPFFGTQAATLTVLPRLSSAMNATVIPVLTLLTPTGYRIEVQPAWDDMGSLSIEQACTKMNTWIEGCASQYPDQYFFSHRRYKTRPANTPQIYP